MSNVRKAARSEFASSLERLLDTRLSTGERAFSRAQWAKILGVTESAISRWVRGNAFPSPEHLNAVLDTLAIDIGITDEAFTEFEQIAARSIDEVSPSSQKRVGPTLEHYLLSPMREASVALLYSLPPWVQEQVYDYLTRLGMGLRETKTSKPSLRDRRTRCAGDEVVKILKQMLTDIETDKRSSVGVLDASLAPPRPGDLEPPPIVAGRMAERGDLLYQEATLVEELEGLVAKFRQGMVRRVPRSPRMPEAHPR